MRSLDYGTDVTSLPRRRQLRQLGGESVHLPVASTRVSARLQKGLSHAAVDEESVAPVRHFRGELVVRRLTTRLPEYNNVFYH